MTGKMWQVPFVDEEIGLNYAEKKKFNYGSKRKIKIKIKVNRRMRKAEEYKKKSLIHRIIT